MQFYPGKFIRRKPVIPAQAGIQRFEIHLAKRDNMPLLYTSWKVLLLDSRLRGNDKANGLFGFMEHSIR
jgi:hypothetical protein